MVDRLIEAFVLQAQFALHAMALGHVLAQRDPAAVGHRVIVQDIVAAVAQALALLERLAGGHLFQPPLPDAIRRGIRKIAARRHGIDHLAHRHADADKVVRQPVHFHEAGIEQHDAVIGVDRAQAVRHLGDRLVEALELDAQIVFAALAIGDVLYQRDPSAAGKRAIVHREGASARHLAQQPERLAARHHVEAPPLDLFELFQRIVAAIAGVPDEVGHRHADPRRLGRQIEQFEEALVEQGQPLFGIGHAQAMRHAGERRFMQRKQFPELSRLGAASLNGVGRNHCASPRPSPRLQRATLRKKARIPG